MMNRLTISKVMLFAVIAATAATAQESAPPVEMQVPKVTAFQLSVTKAIREARKAKKMTTRQALKLRVAMISPSFRQRAEDLAVTQMAFSGSEVPVTETGAIDRASIDWANLGAFLQAVLPLLLQLLEFLGN